MIGRLKTLLIFLGILIIPGLRAQEHDHVQRCATDEIMVELMDQYPEIREARKKSIVTWDSLEHLLSSSKKSAVVYQLPVVFHIVYNSEYDNISKAQVLDGLRILNEDFRRQNSDANKTRNQFLPVAADVEIEFVLATRDPNGNPTNGITRTKSGRSVLTDDNVGSKTVKTVVQPWDRNRYLNIWVVNSIDQGVSNNVLGYAYLASDIWNGPSFFQARDGMVVRHDALGSIGTAANAGRIGRTLPHEIGHYLDLLHPFGDAPYGCNKSDYVNDTPFLDGPSFGCNLNKSTCGSLDQIENYMDYADDECVNMFTIGQKNRMRYAVDNYRALLKHPSTASSTGIINPSITPATATLNMEAPGICPGEQVLFDELSENSPATTWQWYFPGGQPATSSVPNPVVVYPNAGTYDVTLVVSNSAGSDSATYEDFVRVRPYYTGNEASYFESFEGNFQNSGAMINSPEDNTGFVVTSQAAIDGSKSLYLDNFTAAAYAPMTTIKGGGARDEFITPIIFPMFAKNLIMTFEYAFAARQSSSNYDALRVYGSEDCGATWNLIRIFQSGVLRTAPDVPSQPFTPSAGQWRTGLVPLAGYDGKGPVLIKLEFENGGGNNFYIDKIDVTADNVSITEYDLAHNISVYPNPGNGVVNVDFTQETRSEVEVAVYDLYGHKVVSETLPRGTTSYKVGSGEKLASGIYLLQVEEGGMSYSERVVVR